MFRVSGGGMVRLHEADPRLKCLGKGLEVRRTSTNSRTLRARTPLVGSSLKYAPHNGYVLSQELRRRSELTTAHPPAPPPCIWLSGILVLLSGFEP